MLFSLYRYSASRIQFLLSGFQWQTDEQCDKSANIFKHESNGLKKWIIYYHCTIFNYIHQNLPILEELQTKQPLPQIESFEPSEHVTNKFNKTKISKRLDEVLNSMLANDKWELRTWKYRHWWQNGWSGQHQGQYTKLTARYSSSPACKWDNFQLWIYNVPCSLGSS